MHHPQVRMTAQEDIKMKIRTENEVKEFNAALDKCVSDVWLIGANDEHYNMKKEAEYARGLARIMGDEGDQLGIFTTSYEDEIIMMNICNKLAA